MEGAGRAVKKENLSRSSDNACYQQMVRVTECCAAYGEPASSWPQVRAEKVVRDRREVREPHGLSYRRRLENLEAHNLGKVLVRLSDSFCLSWVNQVLKTEQSFATQLRYG
jgi:hypothetical protein